MIPFVLINICQRIQIYIFSVIWGRGQLSSSTKCYNRSNPDILPKLINIFNIYIDSVINLFTINY